MLYIPAFKEIELTRQKFAIVDLEDYEWLSQYGWYYAPHRGTKDVAYARRMVSQTQGRKVSVPMHREIMQHHGLLKEGYVIDHINRDGLCNIKSNLRIATIQQNNTNTGKLKTDRYVTSQYKGVSLVKSGKWKACVFVKQKQQLAGLFPTEYIAAKAYDMLAYELFGEYAGLNFPEERLWTAEEVKANDCTWRKPSGIPYVGVTPKRKKFAAQIWHEGTTVKLGSYFSTPEEAALAYNEAAIRLKGDKAKLNIIPQP